MGASCTEITESAGRPRGVRDDQLAVIVQEALQQACIALDRTCIGVARAGIGR